MMASVMNIASEVMTWFGGSDCVPSACRNMLKTTITRTKQVVIKRMAGARLSTVSSSTTWIVALRPSGLAHFSGPPLKSCGTPSAIGLLPASSARAAAGVKAITNSIADANTIERAISRSDARTRQFAIFNLQFSFFNSRSSRMFLLPAVALAAGAAHLKIIGAAAGLSARPTAGRPGGRRSWSSWDCPAGRCRQCGRLPRGRSLPSASRRRAA